MRFRLPIFLFLLISTLALPSIILASGFQLKTVGALNVDGVTYSHLWYTNGNVTFTGVALENATVTATIDDTSETVTTDAAGDWSYFKSLSEGDHQISFTSNESTLSMTLTIGTDVPEGVGGLPTAETPTVGTIIPTVIVLSSGVFLTLSPFFIKKKR